jgi:hypothetical protein
MKKIFKFRQSVEFGSAISLIIKADYLSEAKNMIFNWITENTTSEDDAFNQGLEYWRSRVDEEKERILYMYDSEEERINQRLRTFLCLGDKEDNSYEEFSVNDFDETPANYNKFAQHNSESTYIWWFKNKEYELVEITEESGVLDFSFIYEGR